ncbi:protein of unknown function (plasmid) [Cupriavidus taiwanensis]|nr:protein of unknown function [Cupriavidus taiwanensis]SPA11480.1 protein of unknown function [Cupriavidus taiwanensis]SPA57388.1 protein of unknown function [Cupriavidus taiwanensis]
MVMPSACISVKSDSARIPGACSCGKKTSLAGPDTARHLLMRRSSVRRMLSWVLVGMVVLELAQNGDGLQARLASKHRHDLGVPDLDEWIGPRAPVTAGLLRRQLAITVDTPGTAHTDAGLGSGNLLGMLFAFGHVEANLLVGNTGSRHGLTAY